jgi:hypothetical protein
MIGALSPESILRARERALGWSVPLLPVEPALGPAAGVDIDLTGDARVAGAEALAQSLALALVTLRGTDIFNTGFGFRGLSAIAEETDAILRRERLRMAVIEVLKDDPRIRRIVAVRFPDETGESDPPVPSAAPPSRMMTVQAEIETVTGERKVVVLGGEALDVR